MLLKCCWGKKNKGSDWCKIVYTLCLIKNPKYLWNLYSARDCQRDLERSSQSSPYQYCVVRMANVAGFTAATPFRHFGRFYFILVPVVSVLSIWDSQYTLVMKAMFIDDPHCYKGCHSTAQFLLKSNCAP